METEANGKRHTDLDVKSPFLLRSKWKDPVAAALNSSINLWMHLIEGVMLKSMGLQSAQALHPIVSSLIIIKTPILES